MISFVNGFLCTSSCHVSKAKRGEDPHPNPDATQNPAKPEAKDGVVKMDDPAVVLSGALSTTAVAPAVAASPSTQLQEQTVNLFV
jgi:hypothetical protein